MLGRVVYWGLGVGLRGLLGAGCWAEWSTGGWGLD